MKAGKVVFRALPPFSKRLGFIELSEEAGLRGARSVALELVIHHVAKGAVPVLVDTFWCAIPLAPHIETPIAESHQPFGA